MIEVITQTRHTAFTPLNLEGLGLIGPHPAEVGITFEDADQVAQFANTLAETLIDNNDIDDRAETLDMLADLIQAKKGYAIPEGASIPEHSSVGAFSLRLRNPTDPYKKHLNLFGSVAARAVHKANMTPEERSQQKYIHQIVRRMLLDPNSATNSYGSLPGLKSIYSSEPYKQKPLTEINQINSNFKADPFIDCGEGVFSDGKPKGAFLDCGESDIPNY